MFEIFTNSDNRQLVVEDLTTGAIVALKDMPISWMILVDNSIKESYPETYDQLVELHGGLKVNLHMRVKQFLSCNFSVKDGIVDIDEHFNFKLEGVFCPARTTKLCKHLFCKPMLTTELSKCEKMVLQLFVAGMSEHEIADKLFLSPCTVHNHINNMYAKTGLKGKTAPDRKLMAYAFKNKYC